MKEQFQDYFGTNKETWEKKVPIHAESSFYDVPSFLNGKSSLNSYELDALEDVNGKSLLHLQCHFAQDTLSWARMGALVTGVDISEEAITLSRKLNKQLGLSAEFVCCNVLDTSMHIQEQFDIIFTSYGVIGWLPDLKPWALMIAQRLKSGGTFYMVEFHPIVWMFDYTGDKPVMKYGYHQDEAVYEEYEGTYAQADAAIISKEYGWNHGLGEVVSALIDSGLKIEVLREHDASPYDVLPDLVKNENGLYESKDHLYPLIFEIKATKI
ncbi:class I SAM-dependent methyltransferase [Dokdonia sp. Asnod1-B02]|uniref:class I SAM-dependent methyltransferase n=1 Tax=Dokdonia sp. Asnod1-B02 TaxID=3160573 RepID=UPI00386AD193